MKKAKELLLSDYPREKYHGYWEKVPQADGLLTVRVYDRRGGVEEKVGLSATAADEWIKPRMDKLKKEA